ncbi:uncharacterized protein LOC142335158 isoform X2 [Convolutriloba macropyga]|uniref:uncharacterized protein LOC142335158 isoform X2 n=1 Tax=Convolutriloba macropyga TaxID=536237 RepID=UPI003F51CCED
MPHSKPTALSSSSSCSDPIEKANDTAVSSESGCAEYVVEKIKDPSKQMSAKNLRKMREKMETDISQRHVFSPIKKPSRPGTPNSRESSPKKKSPSPKPTTVSPAKVLNLSRVYKPSDSSSVSASSDELQTAESKSGPRVSSPSRKGIDVFQDLSKDLPQSSNSVAVIEPEPISIRGFARGLEAEAVLGASTSGPGGRLELLIKWKESCWADFVPAEEAYHKCPLLVCRFYESMIEFRGTKVSVHDVVGRLNSK